MALRAQIVITALIAALIAAGWLWLVGWPAPAETASPSPERGAATRVLVEPLTFAEDRSVVRAVGTGEALRSAALHPDADGEVVAVLFEAEDRVRKDQPLLRLGSAHARLAVRLAEVDEAEARRQIERYQKLARTGTVATATLQTAQAELDGASLRLAQAREALKDRTLHAPFDGVIGLSDIDVGDRVTVDTPVATLDDRSAIRVRFTVPEEYAGRLAVGDPIAVRPWTARDRELIGTISATDSRIDPATRSLRVEARIENPGETIRPGTSFDVSIEFVGRSYPSVREVAVLWSRDGAYLWRVADGRAEKVFVRMIKRDRGRVLVDGPLAAGDRIVVEGVQGLRDGQRVDPAPFVGSRLDAPRSDRGTVGSAS